jgi:glycyl-tRNA synthetase
MSHTITSLETIVSLCKRKGFVFQGSEIYGGIGGMFDYGPLGSLLKRNIEESFIDRFVHSKENMFLIDAAILMNSNVWKATGHVDNFHDPLCEDVITKKRYRADTLLEDNNINPEGMSCEKMTQTIQEKNILSPEGNKLGDVRQFNMMLKTEVGASSDSSSLSYLRPETAQGIFVNFKNIIDAMHPKLPFGVAQIGKAFRNEIVPRNFLFRLREIYQMEIEYAFDPKSQNADVLFEDLLSQQKEWLVSVGLKSELIHRRDILPQDRAHYSSKSVDFEFQFPFGIKELTGCAYRTDFDLSKHSESSGNSLAFVDSGTGEKIMPHIIEPTFGLDRLFFAILVSVYKEELLENNEIRTVLAFPKHIAPYLACVSPLVKNKPEIVEKAREVFVTLKKKFGNVLWDDNGNVGKRYRRQDEIGTPYCVVVDYESLENNTITIRDRDTMEQKRVTIQELLEIIA